jgi:hypothetical protein
MSQSIGLTRNTIDKFYTNDNVVQICIQYFKEYINIDTNDIIIEPSAGNGSFIKYIDEIKCEHEYYDIEPENENIKKQDYLLLDENYNNYNKVHIVGNPPFGRQSSFAIKFIKKSCNFADTISLILPKSFKKESMKKYYNVYFHLVYEVDLPENSFNVNGEIYNVPCIFQIWEKKEQERNILEKIEPIGYSFVKKTDKPHISFRRVGVNAGNIDRIISDKSIQSHYFIKFKNEVNIDNIYEEMKKIKYDFNNTVGPKSIGKQELIKELNIIIQNIHL